MRKDILIYVAHPYSGQKENEEKVAEIIKEIENSKELKSKY